MSLFALLAVGACETIVDIDFPEDEPRITLNSIFWPDANFEVHVSEARPVRYADFLPSIESANVELFRNGTLIERLPHVGDGLYRSPNSRPVAGQTYELRVAATGFQSVVATDGVPADVPIQFDYDFGQSPQSDHLEATILLQDPPEAGNYYRLLAFYRYEGPNGLSMELSGFHTDNDALVTENIDPFEDGKDDQSFFRSAFFTDELLDPGLHQIRIEIRAPEYIQGWFAHLEIHLDVISKPFYDYATTLRKFETFRDNPFKEPVLVANNVQNGFGLFAGFNSRRLVVDLQVFESTKSTSPTSL